MRDFKSFLNKLKFASSEIEAKKEEKIEELQQHLGHENLELKEASDDDSSGQWVAAKSSSNSIDHMKGKSSPLWHDVDIFPVDLGKLVWAKLEGYKSSNSARKNLFFGRICEHGWRKIDDNCELVQFFNPPSTFDAEQTLAQVQLKNIRSFNCPLRYRGSLATEPYMWKEFPLEWDAGVCDNLYHFLKEKLKKDGSLVFAKMKQTAEEFLRLALKKNEVGRRFKYIEEDEDTSSSNGNNISYEGNLNLDKIDNNEDDLGFEPNTEGQDDGDDEATYVQQSLDDSNTCVGDPLLAMSPTPVRGQMRVHTKEELIIRPGDYICQQSHAFPDIHEYSRVLHIVQDKNGNRHLELEAYKQRPRSYDMISRLILSSDYPEGYLPLSEGMHVTDSFRRFELIPDIIEKPLKRLIENTIERQGDLAMIPNRTESTKQLKVSSKRTVEDISETKQKKSKTCSRVTVTVNEGSNSKPTDAILNESACVGISSSEGNMAGNVVIDAEVNTSPNDVTAAKEQKLAIPVNVLGSVFGGGTVGGVEAGQEFKRKLAPIVPKVASAKKQISSSSSQTVRRISGSGSGSVLGSAKLQVGSVIIGSGSRTRESGSLSRPRSVKLESGPVPNVYHRDNEYSEQDPEAKYSDACVESNLSPASQHTEEVKQLSPVKRCIELGYDPTLLKKNILHRINEINVRKIFTDNSKSKFPNYSINRMYSKIEKEIVKTPDKIDFINNLVRDFNHSAFSFTEQQDTLKTFFGVASDRNWTGIEREREQMLRELLRKVTDKYGK